MPGCIKNAFRVNSMINFLTIDVEEWFNFRGLEQRSSIKDWDTFESRIENNMNRVLRILRQHNTCATFFVLGWIAERYPEIVKQIQEQGHEVGTHGYSHKEIYFQTPVEFEAELVRSIELLEKISKEKVISHRASNFSITNKSLWALDILKKHGIKYDSSIYPIKRKVYGIPESRRVPYEIRPGLIELPLATLRLFGRNIPAAGGGYFRIMPYCCTKWAMNTLNKEGKPVVVYIHPWELDIAQPNVKIPFRDKFNHYINLKTTEAKFKKVLREFKFDSIRNILESRGI